jgi:archaellum biogenesis protein FlaJ (TadC family)
MTLPSTTIRFMSARLAVAIAVGITLVLAVMRLFQESWILGVTSLMVLPGTAFVLGSSYVTQQREGIQAEQQATRLRAIGYLLIGVGALFGILMYTDF